MIKIKWDGEEIVLSREDAEGFAESLAESGEKLACLRKIRIKQQHYTFMI